MVLTIEEKYAKYLFDLGLPEDVMFKIEDNRISLYLKPRSNSFEKVIAKLKNELFTNGIQFVVLKRKRFINIVVAIHPPYIYDPSRVMRVTKGMSYMKDYRKVKS